MEAARRASSWGNTQPWCFIVVRDRARIEELANDAARGQALLYLSINIYSNGG